MLCGLCPMEVVTLEKAELQAGATPRGVPRANGENEGTRIDGEVLRSALSGLANRCGIADGHRQSVQNANVLALGQT